MSLDGGTQRFPCQLCSSSFSRMEHLARHQLSHSSDKPFCCTKCNKKFTRRCSRKPSIVQSLLGSHLADDTSRDTLNRHMPIHRTDGSNSRRIQSSTRVSKACSYCARLRLRCDGQNPCERCVSKGVECIYVAGTRNRIMAFLEQHQSRSEAADTLLTYQDSDQAHTPAAHNEGVDDEFGSITVQVPGLSPQSSRPHLQDVVSAVTAHTKHLERPQDGISASDTQAHTAIGLEEIQSSTQMSLGSPGVLPLEEVDMFPADGYGAMSPSMGINEAELLQGSRTIGNSSGSQIDHTTPLGQHAHPLSASAMDDSTTTLAEPDQAASDLLDFEMSWGYDYSLIDWVSPQSPYAEGFQLSLEYDTPSVFLNYGATLQPTPRPHPPISMTTVRETEQSPMRGEIPRSPTTTHPSGTRFTPRMHPHSSSKHTEGGANASAPAESRPQRSANAHQWATDWDPTKQDNQIEFPDMSQVTMDILDAENLAHVNSMSHQTYAEIAKYLSRHSGEHVHFRSFIAANLPPLPAMNCFVQLYFEHFQGIFPMLHQPSFDPARDPWQLVLAVAAIGCRYSKLPGSVQFADALQELLRRAVADTIEADNSTARETWMCQCIILNCLGMSYSGNKRLLEIAETKRNTPATTVRRNGCLSHPFRPQKLPRLGNSSLLEATWREWILEESFKRLGYCAFYADAQIAMHLDFMPCISPSELQRPLPGHDLLWEAPDAETWQELQFKTEKVGGEKVTLSSAMHLLADGKTLPGRLGDFSRLIIVFATYQTTAAISNCVTSSLFPMSSSNRAGMGHLTERAVTVIEGLRPADIRAGSELLRSSLECHISLTLMLLHSRRRDLLNYVHSFTMQADESNARRSLANWIKEDDGKTGRVAASHAGQLLATLRKCSTGGFHEPITALLATLLLWSFNQLSTESSADGRNADPHSLERGSVVRLDRLGSTADTRAWQNGQPRLKPHLLGVGSILRPGAGVKIIETGRKLLENMDVWGLGHGFASRLGKMQASM